jgi:hypothetical protein
MNPGRKPFEYYRGRETWMPIPREFLRPAAR